MIGVRQALVAIAVMFPLAAQSAAVDDVEVALELSELLDTRDSRRGATAGYVDRFYAGRDGTPAWWRAGEWTPDAQAAVEQLLDAERHGLVPADYEAEELEELVLERLGGEGAHSVAAADVLLTASVLRYLDDVANGRVDPKELGWNTDAIRRLDPPTALRNALISGRFRRWIADVGPSRDAYRQLLTMREHYARLADVEWPSLPPGPTLDPGTRDERVAVVRRQLSVLGDLKSGSGVAVEPESTGLGTLIAYRPGSSGGHAPAPASGEAVLFDPELRDAVMRFQERHGLKVDGRVGRSTRRALNISPRQRLEEIELNLERLRWMPDYFGERYLIVNIPAFELKAYAGGAVVQRMKVVVGEPEWPTPILSDRVVNLKFAPDWTIPKSIVQKEILPKVRNDPGYLGRRSIRVFDGWGPGAREILPWRVNELAISARSHVFRQDPGADNALGRVRFSLTNSIGIYLHDTPAKSYFGRSNRALSHGCIRVADPVGLASFLLEREEGWDRERILSAMNRTRTDHYRLNWSTPVHLVYFTAWVDEAGRMQFRHDVYGRNDRLRRAIEIERAERQSVT